MLQGAIYNKTFDVIVSADESGTVCVWSIATGAREGRFNKAHGDAKVGGEGGHRGQGGQVQQGTWGCQGEGRGGGDPKT